MSDYKITLDYSNAGLCMSMVNQIVRDQIQAGVGMATQRVYEEWADRVMKAPGIYAPERTAYIQSLKMEVGDLCGRVWTDYKIADEIETGRPARDLKRMLQTSNKTRQGKNGKYLIIPFRHGTPGNGAHAPAMPPAIYAVARQLPVSKVTGMGARVSATGSTVAQASYSWGGRLPAGMSQKLKPHHATDIHAGMVRFDTSTGKSKSSQFLTFRVMTEQSKGWIIGAKPGLYIARNLASDIQADVEAIISSSL